MPIEFQQEEPGRENPGVNDHSKDDHDPLGSSWIVRFTKIKNRPPTDVDRQDYLFSLLYFGSGPDGSWTDLDWSAYLDRRQAFWSGELMWPGENTTPGYDRFGIHLERLSTYYGYTRKDRSNFSRAVGLVWGGIIYQGSVFKALAEASVGDHLSQLYEGASGWNARFVDDANPAHHWVAGFVAGFHYGVVVGVTVNSIRDIAQFITAKGGTLADIELGNIAAFHGSSLAQDSNDDRQVYNRLFQRMRRDLCVG
jgi:hypothetical protein